MAYTEKPHLHTELICNDETWTLSKYCEGLKLLEGLGGVNTLVMGECHGSLEARWQTMAVSSSGKL